MATAQQEVERSAAIEIDDGSATRDARGEWRPRILGKALPFRWPVQPRELFRFFLGFPGFLWPFGAAAHYGLAAATWRFLQPGSGQLSHFSHLSAGWIVPMYLRNLVMLLLVAGTLHIILYWRRLQGTRFKYNSRWPGTHSKIFLFNNQVRDNMFWSLASGATIWTVYEVLMLWAYGNGWLSFITLYSNPVWFVVLAIILPFWQDVHFYIVHRISHWKPLYDAAHYLHHRNTNVGPWSGLSMHPIEHILYFSRWVILFVVPSHPIHMFYLMQRPALNPALGHTGFDRILLKKDADRGMSVDSYFHYLHHRYFECNYGTITVPLDRWLGSLHDGTPESLERMRRKRRIPAE
ncbi:MAG: sterol desaturase family protein [Fuerstiella sp.]|nr:sterol desaturase family protein [Fuerstiella sp.]